MAEAVALVTGAAGFIGRHLARHLSRLGFSVLGLGHGEMPPEQQRAWGLAGWRSGDVNPAMLRATGGTPAVLFHCAGGSSVPFSVAHPGEDRRRTVESTRAALGLARERGLALVLVSSGSVCGSSAGPIAEDAPPRPESPYAAHKLEAEELCREHGARHGVACAVVRLFSAYGPGLRKQLLWDACGRLLAGTAVFAGSGAERRDLIHVEDAVALLERAAGRASTEVPVVHGGTGQGVEVREVVAELARALGAIRPPVFTGQARAGDPLWMVADNRLARSWGWSPAVPWREGVRDYARWYQAGGR